MNRSFLFFSMAGVFLFFYSFNKRPSVKIENQIDRPKVFVREEKPQMTPPQPLTKPKEGIKTAHNAQTVNEISKSLEQDQNKITMSMEEESKALVAPEETTDEMDWLYRELNNYLQDQLKFHFQLSDNKLVQISKLRKRYSKSFDEIAALFATNTENEIVTTLIARLGKLNENYQSDIKLLVGDDVFQEVEKLKQKFNDEYRSRLRSDIQIGFSF